MLLFRFTLFLSHYFWYVNKGVSASAPLALTEDRCRNGLPCCVEQNKQAYNIYDSTVTSSVFVFFGFKWHFTSLPTYRSFDTMSLLTSYCITSGVTVGVDISFTRLHWRHHHWNVILDVIICITWDVTLASRVTHAIGSVISCVVNYVITDVISDVSAVDYGAAIVTGKAEDRRRDSRLVAAAGGVSVMYPCLLFETVREATLELSQNEEQDQFPRLTSERVEFETEVLSEHLHTHVVHIRWLSNTKTLTYCTARTATSAARPQTFIAQSLQSLTRRDRAIFSCLRNKCRNFWIK